MDLSPRRLDALLVALDLTNDDLAMLSGVTQRTVYRWLAGTTPVARSVIAMLELMQQARA
jgi:transcriptional regulator with XRE-family HTH domain